MNVDLWAIEPGAFILIRSDEPLLSICFVTAGEKKSVLSPMHVPPKPGGDAVVLDVLTIFTNQEGWPELARPSGDVPVLLADPTIPRALDKWAQAKIWNMAETFFPNHKTVKVIFRRTPTADLLEYPNAGGHGWEFSFDAAFYAGDPDPQGKSFKKLASWSDALAGAINA